MQITSSEKINKLTPLKFEVLDVARKTINAIPSQYLLTVAEIHFFRWGAKPPKFPTEL
jgi:hypothetical protein